MNWMILTKMLRGVSLGTTLREPFGKSAETMLSSRLVGEKRGYFLSYLVLTNKSKYLKDLYLIATDSSVCVCVVLELTSA